VLQQFPNGGPELISLVRDGCLGNPSALSSIIALLGNAKTDQQMAIGSGLGQCAQLSVRTNPAFADQIQNAIALSGIQNAILAFAGVTGNVPIASTGVGAGGVGGGAGGPTGSGGVSGGTNTGTSTPGVSFTATSSVNYFTSANSAHGATVSGSVSPHH
jgi:hypothetical protein